MEKYFLTELDKIKKQYQEEENKKAKLNIFRALHKANDEKYLHSRFISYLLSPTSKHRMGDAFLRKFIEESKLKDFELDGDIEIFPNEDNKSEIYNIDILIINKTTNQAIIIENKINAKDSNHKNIIKQDLQIHDSESTYSNSDQDDIAQLISYFKKFKDTYGFKYDNEVHALSKIQLVYLTLNKKEPSLIEQFKDYNLSLIDYRTEIRHWLKSCINDVGTDHFLEEILRQYLDITIQITNDVERAKNLKELISDYIDLAWYEEVVSKKISKMYDFTHVKWHTVDEFWNGLIKVLINELNVDKFKKIGYDEIRKQTHNDSKKPYGIVFEINGKQLYVMNDAQNGLTIGLATSPDINKPKEQWDTIDDQIKFFDFTNKDTFELINMVKRKELIAKTIEKIKEFSDRDINYET